MEKRKKYTSKFFKEGLPEWKRIKDPPTSRILYRPLSFITSSVCANLGISANSVSYFSTLIAIIACILFIIPNYICNIIGAILVNIWLLLDCTDGNIARTVKKQPFGDFADSISSYTLVAFLCSAMGISSYFSGGLIFEKKSIWIVLLGILASTSDTLMRLVYHKYKASEKELAEKGVLEVEYDKRKDTKATNSLLVRIESDFGIGGILPLMILIGTIFKSLDLVVIYCFIYFFFSGLVMNLKYVKKAIDKTKAIEENKIKEGKTE